LEAIKSIQSWAKDAELHADELLLVTNEEGGTVLHMTAEKNQVELL